MRQVHRHNEGFLVLESAIASYSCSSPSIAYKFMAGTPYDPVVTPRYKVTFLKDCAPRGVRVQTVAVKLNAKIALDHIQYMRYMQLPA